MRSLSIYVTAAALSLGAPAWADTTTLNPDSDNTLIQTSDGSLSNALGDIYVGRTNQADASSRRRGAVLFDVAGGVPAGSTINSVTLRLWLARAGDNTVRNVSVHAATASWGEGTSYFNGGVGDTSTTNDATWLHRFYSGTSWTSTGGDYNGTASATASGGSSSTIGAWYTWSTTAMKTDVQGWLTTPASNHGWILVGDESTSQTARRFTSRESTDDAGAHYPELVIDYTPPPSATAPATQLSAVRTRPSAAQGAELSAVRTRPSAASGAAVSGIGTARGAAPALPAGLRLLGERDLDGDGEPDLLLRGPGGALLGGRAAPSGFRTWELALDRGAADPLAVPPASSAE